MAGFQETRVASGTPYFWVRESHDTPVLMRSQRLQFAATPACVGPGAGTAPGMVDAVGWLVEVTVMIVVLGTKPSTLTQMA